MSLDGLKCSLFAVAGFRTRPSRKALLVAEQHIYSICQNTLRLARRLPTRPCQLGTNMKNKSQFGRQQQKPLQNVWPRKSPALTSTLSQALALHQAGRLAEATLPHTVVILKFFRLASRVASE